MTKNTATTNTATRNTATRNTGPETGAETPTEPRASTVSDRTRTLAVGGGVVGTLFAGAIFGFFYAWSSSTMQGLDATDPRVAIQAMQSVNANIRNPIFFPIFFLTPVALLAAATLARTARAQRAAIWFGAAALIYIVGGMLVTAGLNIPLNDDLGRAVIPASVEEAGALWSDYSGIWQFWNAVRTVFSGIALGAAALGLIELGRSTPGPDGLA